MILKGGIILLILILCLGSHGLLYEKNLYNPNSNTFERSLEYRNDLKLHRQIAKSLEDNFPGFTVGAPVVIAQLLNFAEVGYVKSPRNVVVYGAGGSHEGIRPFTGLKNIDARKTIWVGLGIEENIKFPIPFPIDPDDKILQKLQVGDKIATLYMGGFAIEKMRVLVELKRRSLIAR